MNPPLEEVLARGDAAASLLGSSTFVEVMNDLSNYHLTAMTACRPGPADAESRDYHHTMLHALREIVDELQTRSAAGDEVKRRLDIDDEQDIE